MCAHIERLAKLMMLACVCVQAWVHVCECELVCMRGSPFTCGLQFNEMHNSISLRAAIVYAYMRMFFYDYCCCVCYCI